MVSAQLDGHSQGPPLPDARGLQTGMQRKLGTLGGTRGAGRSGKIKLATLAPDECVIRLYGRRPPLARNVQMVPHWYPSP